MAHVERRARPERETIHSGHFMVSHFEAEAQDDDDLTGTGVPVPDEEPNDTQQVVAVTTICVAGADPLGSGSLVLRGENTPKSPQQISIETSLTKLFKCMTLAYRQKLTSPKWNRFKGVKLRWKDKIRLNNVIWRCWHMQFIKRKNTQVCQFASPLDVDLHVKPETTILEGKYWKRRAEAVTAEYKKWRMFHTRLQGRADSALRDAISDKDTVETFSLCDDMAGSMLMDEDYINFMSDTLFSTITSNQPFAFPDTREIARGASLADFIQPSLGPLQPNLDDFMDTLEPFQELLSQTRLPPVPEESSAAPEDAMFRGALSLDVYGHTYPASGQSLPHSLPSISQSSSGMLTPQSMSAAVKNELQMDTTAVYPTPDIHPFPPPLSHAYTHADTHASMHGSHYSGKRMTQYTPSNKIVIQSETSYGKPFTTQVTAPTQSAPETISHLQQSPVYPRERASRPRIAQYSGQLPPHYQTYSAPAPAPALYHAGEGYKKRGYKPPSQSGVSQQISPSGVSGVVASKDSFRSNSLPLGAQLNADWTVSPADSSPRVQPQRVGAARRRSRSSGGAAGAGGRRVPPPLNSVASDSALPQTSVMLAQLLTSQHSQSVYKTTASSEDVSERSPASPLVRPSSYTEESALSPMTSGSPGTPSPLSPRSPEPRRATHMHAEQKRRFNIKHGFDTLQALIPHLNHSPAAKVSKASLLQKGAEYIKQLKAERSQIKDDMENMRHQIECLNNSISNCHALLPATGAPVSRARAGRLREMFARHVAARTTNNHKYWVFSVVAANLVDSFSNCVAVGNRSDLARTTQLWAEQHCCLVEMRPAVLGSLRVLCSMTDVLTSPERLPEEARAAAAAAAASAAAVKSEPV